MFELENYSRELMRPQERVEQILKSIVKEKAYLQWTKTQRLKFFKGNVSQDKFRIKSAYLHETICLFGSLSSDDSNTCQIHIHGKINWFYYLLYAIILLALSVSLLLLSILMMQTNLSFGILSLFIVLSISIGLYRNLIGQQKRRFIELCDGLIARVKQETNY